jgi:hypothetical protein
MPSSRHAVATVEPFDSRTSASRSSVTICSGEYLFLVIENPL